MTNNENYFPDNELDGRSLLAFNWLPEKNEKLLDAGCSYGYSTVYFSKKAQDSYGIDANESHIKAAQAKYPSINFTNGFIESLPYSDNYFDAIVMMDVLEHTQDKIKSLSEIYRVLKVGGKFIFSTPHSGTYEFLDPYNFGYYMRTKVPFIYKPLYKLIRRLKDGKFPELPYNPEHLDKHYHYSERILVEMLNSSAFKNNFKIHRIFKSGLYKEVLAMLMESVFHIIFSRERTRKLLEKFMKRATQDYWNEYGSRSYNIAIMLEKIR